MHELSIAIGIVKIAEDETKKANVTRVTKIDLEIGVLSGVEIDALDFVWDAAVKGSVLETAEKEITIIEGKGKCVDCDLEFAMEYIYDSCPACGSHFKGILQGKEMRVKALEVI